MKQGKNKNPRHQKENDFNKQLLNKKQLKLILFLAFLGAIYHFYIEPKQIGYDSRYLVYVFILPTIVGAAVIGIYRRQFLSNQFSRGKGFLLRIFMMFFYLLQGLVFSYISFGQLTKMSWVFACFLKAKDKGEETLYCDVARFYTGRQSAVEFKFKGHSERFRVPYSEIKPYKSDPPSNYYLKIKAAKGLWDYYRVQDWIVQQK